MDNNTEHLINWLERFLRVWEDKATSIMNIDRLIDVYDKFLSKHGLPEMSADELIIELRDNGAEAFSYSKALNQLYTDFLMLQDGSWQPDNDTVEASIDNLALIAEELGVTLEDQRELCS